MYIAKRLPPLYLLDRLFEWDWQYSDPSYIYLLEECLASIEEALDVMDIWLPISVKPPT